MTSVIKSLESTSLWLLCLHYEYACLCSQAVSFFFQHTTVLLCPVCTSRIRPHFTTRQMQCICHQASFVSSVTQDCLVSSLAVSIAGRMGKCPLLSGSFCRPAHLQKHRHNTKQILYLVLLNYTGSIETARGSALNSAFFLMANRGRLP